MWKGGPLTLCGITALFSALAAGAFALVLRRIGSRDDLLGALALGSTPAFYLASVQALDYAWALAFCLAALSFALGGRAAAAGVCVGLAIGCRITSGAWLIPLALVLAKVGPPGTRMRRVLVCCALAIGIGALAYLPVVLTYGPGFFRFYESVYPSLVVVVKQATVDLWGIPGMVALGVALLLGLRPGGSQEESVSAGERRWRVAAWGIGIALYLAAYFKLPDKAFYLIPVIPFTLLLLAELLSRRSFVAVCVALVLSPWVLKVSQPGRADAPPSTVGTMPFRALGQPFLLDVFRGPVLTDHARRVQSSRYVDRTLARARELSGENVILAWQWLPEIRVRLGGKAQGRALYVYLLEPAELEGLVRRGVSVYYLAGAEWDMERVHGIRLRERGAVALHEGER